MKNQFCLAFFATMALSLHATAAMNEIDAPRVTRIVKFDDLDLNRASGTATLYARLRHAAQQVCDPVDARVLSQMESTHRCVENAIERAVTQVNSPGLLQYRRQQSGGPITLADAR